MHLASRVEKPIGRARRARRARPTAATAATATAATAVAMVPWPPSCRPSDAAIVLLAECYRRKWLAQLDDLFSRGRVSTCDFFRTALVADAFVLAAPEVLRNENDHVAQHIFPVCLGIALKFEGGQPCAQSTFPSACQETDRATKDRLIRIERLVLDRLEYRIAGPTVLTLFIDMVEDCQDGAALPITRAIDHDIVCSLKKILFSTDATEPSLRRENVRQIAEQFVSDQNRSSDPRVE
jgi:hypothetical protein